MTNPVENIERIRVLLQEIANDGVVANVFTGVKWIGGIALTFMIMRSVFLSFSSGGEKPLKWFDDILKPLLLIGILSNWLFIMSIFSSISSSISNSIESVTVGKVDVNISENFANQQSLLHEKLIIESVIENDKIEKNSSVFSPVESFGNELDYAKKSIQIESLTAFSSFGMTIQNLVGIAFAAYAGLVLLLLKVTGGIALVISYFPKMESGFFSWLKNFIAVHLWFAIATLVFFLVDSIYLEVIEIYGLNVASVTGGGIGSTLPSQWGSINLNGTFEESIAIFRKQAWLFIAFGVLKGILMFKIPNIVSMFIGSSSGSGGMFAAVFAPVKMAGTAGKSLSGSGGLSRLTGR